MAVIEWASRTETSMKVYLNALDTNYDNNKRICKWYIMEQKPEGVYIHLKDMTLENKIYASPTLEIINLQPATTYVVKAEISAEGWNKPVELTRSIKTEGGSTDPDKPVEPEIPPEEQPSEFYWSARALEAFTNHGLTTELTAEEWNSFVKEIKKYFRKWDIAPVTFEPGDRITADAINYVMNTLPYFSIDDRVFRGYPCTGQTFIDLQDNWNKWMNS